MAYGCVNVPGVTPDELAEVRRKGSYFGVCSTDSGSAAKTVAVDDSFILMDGAEVVVKFTVTTQAVGSTLTLDVNNTGAKEIFYKGSKLPVMITTPTSYCFNLQANVIYTFRYNSGGNNGNGCWDIAGNLYEPIVQMADKSGGLLCALNVKFNGQTQEVFWGNENKTINITPAGIGAAEYETGNWTPQLKDSGSIAPISYSSATYSKVGNDVHLRGFISISSAANITNMKIGNLPFPISAGIHMSPIDFFFIGEIRAEESGTNVTSSSVKSTIIRMNSPTELSIYGTFSKVGNFYIDLIYNTYD